MIVKCAGGCKKDLMPAQADDCSPTDDFEYYCEECFEKEKARREAQS